MELDELKLLAAASLLAGSITASSHPTDEGIAKAVRTAKRIWEEVLRQERERPEMEEGQ